jgi:hypothetical protein
MKIKDWKMNSEKSPLVYNWIVNGLKRKKRVPNNLAVNFFVKIDVKQKKKRPKIRLARNMYILVPTARPKTVLGKTISVHPMAEYSISPSENELTDPKFENGL